MSDTPLTVTVLGSSGSFASPDNGCTSYLVQGGDTTVLVDAGPGCLGPLQRHIEPDQLDAVVLTHCHPDHWLELPVVRNVLTYFTPLPDGVRLPVYGTAATRRMDAAVAVIEPPRVDALDWRVIDETARIAIGDLSLRFSRTDHTVETLAVRVDYGERSWAFSSDTGPGWSLAGLGDDIDMAFVDASHLSAYEGQGIPHMSAREAGRNARDAGVARLVLTHLVPGSDPEAHRAEAEPAYGGPVEVALPGLRLTV